MLREYFISHGDWYERMPLSLLVSYESLSGFVFYRAFQVVAQKDKGSFSSLFLKL